jgi:shikimate dehydrogenase
MIYFDFEAKTGAMLMIGGSTRLFGIFADPISQVKAPGAFNAILHAHKVDAVFVPFHVQASDFERAVAGLRVLRNFGGFTLTLPHKIAAASICDRLGPISARCGAVNAVRCCSDGTLEGETFDGIGMVKAIATLRTLDRQTCVLLAGAGGAGRAIAFALAEAGIGTLRIANRSQGAAGKLADNLATAFPQLVIQTGDTDPSGCDIAINATSLGLNGGTTLPFDPLLTGPDAIIADAVMEPAVTPLLVHAQAGGKKIVTGRRMLEEQVMAMADFLGMIPR